MANHKKHYAVDYKKRYITCFAKYIYSIFKSILTIEPADNITKKDILPSHSINIYFPYTVSDFILT